MAARLLCSPSPVGVSVLRRTGERARERSWIRYSSHPYPSTIILTESKNAANNPMRTVSSGVGIKNQHRGCFSEISQTQSRNVSMCEYQY